MSVQMNTLHPDVYMYALSCEESEICLGALAKTWLALFVLLRVTQLIDIGRDEVQVLHHLLTDGDDMGCGLFEIAHCRAEQYKLIPARCFRTETIWGWFLWQEYAGGTFGTCRTFCCDLQFPLSIYG